MERKQIESSRVKSVGHQGHALEIEFNNGRIYQYSPVTQEAYLNMLRSESIGKWVQKNIINNANLDCELQPIEEN